ncbi:DsbA family protein [Pseudarthrobacter sp. NS4]|uniref:DsbA family protein n=1 Tax=Pseudarthrobacter sp. NS4 TaxID=2973976 RepID=UPI0021634A9D|nr:DsbA family protein [Pseudarthrobacter sp. NS4]
MTSTKLTYVFDAYCGWCYGFAPALHELAQDEGIDIEVISGGLFSGHHAGPIGALPHIPGANARIAALTGVRFGEAYGTVLSDGTLHMDSDDAGTGLVALKEASGGKDLDMAAAMQHAFYIDGLSLSETGTYRTIATREGLDPDLVEKLYTDPGTREKALSEQERVADLGIHSYPTLLMHTAAGPVKIGSPVYSAQQLRKALKDLQEAQPS